MAGYSPYKDLIELIDPAQVGDDRSRWGFVTWLENLGKISDANVPFELYKKGESKHFSFERGPVDLNATKMPAGIGVLQSKGGAAPGLSSTEQYLIDPMTKERIDKVPLRDASGKEVRDRNNNVVAEVNDQWFILKMKFVWKDAGAEAAATPATASPVGTGAPGGFPGGYGFGGRR